MRIGIDITPLAGTRVGVGNYCYYLLKHLLKQSVGDEVIGLASGTKDLVLDELGGKINYRRIPLPTRVLYKLWSSLEWPKADTVLGGVDLFHATNFFLPPVRAARRVVTVHDVNFLVKPELASPKIRGLLSREIGRFVQEADAVIACSESTKSDIVRLLGVVPEKVTVAYEAVEDDFAPMEAEDGAVTVQARYHVRQPFILFVGTLEPRKNIPRLLRAFSTLAKDYPHDLVLVGPKGWGMQEIQKTLQELRLGNRVHHLGYLKSKKDLAAFYSAAEVFVLPSLYEGFGLPLLEAMACGTPVVTTNNSSIPEVVGDAAVCVDAEDIDALAGAIRRIIEEPSLRESMSALGMEQAARFSWERCARTTMDVYRSLA